MWRLAGPWRLVRDLAIVDVSFETHWAADAPGSLSYTFPSSLAQEERRRLCLIDGESAFSEELPRWSHIDNKEQSPGQCEAPGPLACGPLLLPGCSPGALHPRSSAWSCLTRWSILSCLLSPQQRVVREKKGTRF